MDYEKQLAELGLVIVGPLDTTVPGVRPGWMVQGSYGNRRVAELEARGWRACPSGPRHTIVNPPEVPDGPRE